MMHEFPSIDEVNIILDEITDEIPPEFFNQLNEGIVLLPEVKEHPESTRGDRLYILGEYRKSFTGRNIAIYYGSFERVHGGVSVERLRKELKDTLLHEFTHHLESLAGERGLEVKDAQFMERFRSKSR